jgi:hypothetical protein
LAYAGTELLRFRWTGSNTNPHNNDGQGRAGTDRSNVVLQQTSPYQEGTGLPYVGIGKNGHWGRSYPEMVRSTSFLGLGEDDIINLAILRNRELVILLICRSVVTLS